MNSNGQRNSYIKRLFFGGLFDEADKKIFTFDEPELVFELWKQGAGFSDIRRVIDAKPGSVFTILRESCGIKPNTRNRNTTHLTLSERYLQSTPFDK